MRWRFRAGRKIWRTCWAVACCTWPLAAAALDPDRTLSELPHTRWTIKDGAPGEIWSLAQSADGWLWLGSTTGLYRFDGVRFEKFEPLHGEAFRSNSISSLFALPTGELWIGFVYGGISLLKNGHLAHFSAAEGVTPGTVFSFETSADGALWAATSAGLIRFDGTRFQKAGADWNYPGNAPDSLILDQRGVMWVAAGNTLLALRPGAKRFERVEPAIEENTSLFQAQDGAIWSRSSSGVQPLAAAAPPLRPRDPWINSRTADSTLFDRDGGIWSGACERGICRIGHPERLAGQPFRMRTAAQDVFEAKDGLSSDAVMTLLEDREGNVWASTRRGLDRFRHGNVVTVELPNGALNLAMVAGDDGMVWVGSNAGNKDDEWLYKIAPRPVVAQGFKGAITCAYRAPDGTLWFAGADALWRKEGSRFLKVALPPKDAAADVHAMVKDGDGKLWVSIVRAGLFRLDGDTWTPNGNVPNLPQDRDRPTAAAVDERGRPWFGYQADRVAVVEGQTARLFSANDGLAVGAVTALFSGAPLLVGGELGLAFFKDNRFYPLQIANLEIAGVTGIIVTTNGDLWLNGNMGIAHIVAAEFQSSLASPSRPMRAEMFDFQDGVPGTAQQLRPLPTAIQGSDGRLWFAETDGIAWIDPAHIKRNAVKPNVLIRSLTADGKAYALADHLVLPQLTERLQIDYAALSLSIPERVQFKYQLEGADETWQSAGPRREAYYTNLAPGNYRFRVIASNNDGVWNDTGATLDFSISPAFHQTQWFFALSALSAIALLALLYWLRMQQMAARLESRLQERLQERERIARELHDTLLQGIHGLTLKFQAAKEAIPKSEPARALMESALNRADEVIAEGRDRVKDLRSHEPGALDLPQALMRVGEELAEDYPADFRIVVEGASRKLHPLVGEETYRIAREALFNAFWHSRAKSIEAEVAYDRKLLRVRVRDDGVGISQDILDTGGRDGHFGLAGMRERARKLGAHIDIWSRPDAGTEVELRVPGAMAYRERHES